MFKGVDDPLGADVVVPFTPAVQPTNVKFRVDLKVIIVIIIVMMIIIIITTTTTIIIIIRRRRRRRRRKRGKIITRI